MCITACAISNARVVDPDEDLGAHRGAGLGPGVAPGGDRGRIAWRAERVDVGVRVGDAELDPVGRALLAGPRRRGGLLEGEGLAAMRLERRRARGRGVLGIVAGSSAKEDQSRDPQSPRWRRPDAGDGARPGPLTRPGRYPIPLPWRAAKGPAQRRPRPFSSTICRSCVMPVEKPASLIAR